jgi:hypothetical protein
MSMLKSKNSLDSSSILPEMTNMYEPQYLPLGMDADAMALSKAARTTIEKARRILMVAGIVLVCMCLEGKAAPTEA